jgi:hypothetical protein
MENVDQQIRKNAITSGLIYGIIVLVLSILSFYFITTMTTSFVLMLVSPIVFSIAIPLLIIVFLCLDLRKKIGGFWSFKQATTGAFIILFTAFLVSTIGKDVLFMKFIEPNMVEKTQDAMMGATRSLMEKSGSDQSQIDEKMADVKKQFDAQKNLSAGKIIQGYAITILLLFAFALILGAVFRRTPLRIIEEPTA